MPKILVILNPHARRNRKAAKDNTARLQQVVGSWGEVCCTPTLDDLRSTLRRVGPVDYLVCDGGDGSLHWAVNTAIETWGNRLPAFVPTRGGTIDFVAAKAGIVGSPAQVLRTLVRTLSRGAEPRLATIDTLSIQGKRNPEAASHPFSRIGFALAAGGIG
jgi:diacylglycerol kinase family enzyme